MNCHWRICGGWRCLPIVGGFRSEQGHCCAGLKRPRRGCLFVFSPRESRAPGIAHCDHWYNSSVCGSGEAPFELASTIRSSQLLSNSYS